MDTKSCKDVELLTAVSRLGLMPKEAIQILTEYQDKDISSLLELEICKDKPEIFDRLRNFFENLGFQGIELNSNLNTELPLDSIDKVDLRLFIQKEYSIELQDDVVDTWETVDDVVNKIYNETHPIH